jgi:hypothetical protein
VKYFSFQQKFFGEHTCIKKYDNYCGPSASEAFWASMVIVKEV